MADVIERYASALEAAEASSILRTPAPSGLKRLDRTAQGVASAIAEAAAGVSMTRAAFELGALYTFALPTHFRSEHGVFYTPPALSDHLLDMAEAAGVDWRTARVLDPACGGGAFLTPTAERIVTSLNDCLPPLVLQNIAGRLRGMEVDPFAAWMSQVFLEITLRDVTRAAGRALPQLVTVCDSLDAEPPTDGFDLVVGNPPFGKVRLSDEQRSRYKRSLYGHANLYSVFTDLAVRWTRPGGVIAYITPTSFLAGEYFKALRRVLLDEAPPVAIHLVADRKGTFEDVLQETALSTFKRGGAASTAQVCHLNPLSTTAMEQVELGAVRLPSDREAPWLLPRTSEDALLVRKLAARKTRLADWGFGVSTGPLVWNRHKSQITAQRTRNTLPLIWAEAVTPDGRFAHRAEKKNHAPYFEIAEDDEWLITREPCVLLQRTTAKEQHRRLIAAELPAEYLRKHGAVVIENHLNMVKPLACRPKVSPKALAAVLNSRIVDRAFRCISGSVAVSAFELEALPLPTVKQMAAIERLVVRGATPAQIEDKLTALYGMDVAP